MRITICFGGSTFNSNGLDVFTIEEIVESIKNLKEENHEILVVVGGGKTSKKYISAAKDLDIPNRERDQLGIKGTRLNARLLISALGDIADRDVTQNFEKAIRITLRDKIPVMGGTQPGHTTDAVAAELADVSDSDLLIFFTDVNGVYTADPKKNKNAEKIDKMTTSELAELMSEMDFKPGMRTIIDPLATKIMEKTGIRTLVLDKEEISRLPKIVAGSKHHGTEIVPETE